MANNFANVEHMADRNVDGIAYMKTVLATVMGVCTKTEKENEMGNVAMAAIKTMARTAFGRLPLFRTAQLENGVMTFQAFFNEFAEANDLNAHLRVTGVWNEATQNAFDMIVEKYTA